LKHGLTIVGLVVALAAGPSAARTLDIYFIDVEGGQSTLLVTPAGQSLLIDAGYPGFNGRDPARIMAAAHDAKIKRLDYLVITHFHEDHDGGAGELARRIPIDTFVDYGAPIQTEKDVVAAFATYEEARRKGKHLVAKPGDRLPLRGIDVDVVSSGGAILGQPLAGAGQPNDACSAYERRGDNNTENPRSLGVRVRYGAFRFLDLGDLVWNKLGELVCPINLVGEIDAYLVAHHGNGDSNVPAVLAALRPRVAILNNGEYKGGTATTLTTLRTTPGLQDGVWQLHRSFSNGAENFPDAFVANVDGDEKDLGAWLKLSASQDGTFSMTNGRTGWTRTYPVGKVEGRR